MPKSISATINPQVVEDIDNLVSKGHYRNRSHAVEEGLKRILVEQES
jgi:Arc/MetJ-type ribon-helix-helix transcriptional regulator